MRIFTNTFKTFYHPSHKDLVDSEGLTISKWLISCQTKVNEDGKNQEFVQLNTNEFTYKDDDGCNVYVIIAEAIYK